jgi:hypothetical protein
MGAPCPTNCNPAEFFIQLLAIVPTREDTCRQTIDMVCDSFQASEAGQRILAETELQGQVIVNNFASAANLSNMCNKICNVRCVYMQDGSRQNKF